MNPKIHVIAVAYCRFGELKVFVQSILNQSSSEWFLSVYHDGISSEFDLIMNEYKKNYPNKIDFYSSKQRYNDYGHTLRDIALKSARGEYVLLTNADNYFIPKAIEYLVNTLNYTNADIVIYDMIHSHNKPGGRPLPPYSFFETAYSAGSIDVSAAIVRRTLAQKVGFRDKSHDGDATYFKDMLIQENQKNISIVKIPQVLFVHN